MKGWQLWLILRELKKGRLQQDPQPKQPSRFDLWLDKAQDENRARKAERQARRNARRH